MVERYSVKAEQRKFEWENGWDQTRRTMAMIGNMFRGKDTPPLLPTDIFRLSWDKVDEFEIKDPEEIKAYMLKRFGSTIKKKDGSE